MFENKTENEKKDATFYECSRCKKHMERKNLKFSVDGEEYTVRQTNDLCPGCEIAREAEDRYRQKQELFTKRLQESGMSKKQMRYSFENFVAEDGSRRPWVSMQEYKLSPRGIFLYGETTGVGKTHLMAALARRLMVEHDVVWMNLASFLDGLRQRKDNAAVGLRFEGNGSRACSFDRALRAPVLFIDDLGAERETDWVGERLFILLNERLEEERPTFISSNFRLAYIQEIFGGDYGPKIASRIAGMCSVFTIKGTDHRLLLPKT